MKYTRETDPGIMIHIEPHLSFAISHSKENFLRVVINRMSNQPEEVFIYSAKEEDTLRAFIIIEAPRGETYVWVAQAWSDSRNDWSIADNILHRARIWTAAIGRKKMRAETFRNAEAFSRRFSFELVALIVEHVVPDDLLERANNGQS